MVDVPASRIDNIPAWDHMNGVFNGCIQGPFPSSTSPAMVMYETKHADGLYLSIRAECSTTINFMLTRMCIGDGDPGEGGIEDFNRRLRGTRLGGDGGRGLGS